MEPSPGLALACAVVISDLGVGQEREIELEREATRDAPGKERARPGWHTHIVEVRHSAPPAAELPSPQGGQA